MGIEDWREEPERNFTTIHAVIYVGRANHKGMVIGKSGQHLKQIGIEARKEIETLLEHRVHLELWVKVREGWTEDPAFLQGLTTASEE